MLVVHKCCEHKVSKTYTVVLYKLNKLEANSDTVSCFCEITISFMSAPKNQASN